MTIVKKNLTFQKWMEKIKILSENFLIGIFLLMLLGICMTDHIFNHQIHCNKHTEKGAYDGKQW